MKLTKEDIQVIETIVRQQWCNPTENSEQARFEGWMSVDQDQALAPTPIDRPGRSRSDLARGPD